MTLLATMDLKTVGISLALLVVMAAAQGTYIPCKPVTGSYTLFTSIDEDKAEIGTEVYYVDIVGNPSEVQFLPAYNDYFAFNTTTQWVVVNGTIDAEISDESQDLIITCRNLDLGNELDIKVTISIYDTNDNGPIFTNDVYTLSVGEMTEVGTVLGTDILATDADVRPINNGISYIVLDGPHSDYFVMTDPVRQDITLLKELDYETLPTFDITIMAKDSPSSGQSYNATCVLTIVVRDEDDQYPVFNSSVYQAFIASTDTSGSLVQVQPGINAFDPDLSLNADIEYSFHGGDSDLLSIDKDTAVITLNDGPPTSKEMYLLLQATQVDNPSRYGVALLAVQVQGSNVNAPEFVQATSQATRTESFPVGEIIATMVATDAEAGTIITYSLDEASKQSFTINQNTGDITLTSALSYLVTPQHVIKVTASDGELQSTAQLTLLVAPVNNKPPVILNSNLNVTVARAAGTKVIDILAQDNDEGVTVLTYQVLTHANLFAVDSAGRVTVSGTSDDLHLDEYQVALTVSDDGQPSYSTPTVVTVSFPPVSAPPVAAASMSDSDDLLTIILAAVVAVLLVVVIILVVYLCRRRLRETEHLDRAKRQLPSQDAKALAFKQQGTLGRQNKVNIEFGQPYEQPYAGNTSVQENPLNGVSNGTYFNFGQIHSDDDTEADMNEIHVETSVTPFHSIPVNHVNDDNNNDNIYNSSQMSEESEEYAPSDKQAITSFFRNGSLSTYQDSSDSETSTNTSPTESHDSKKNLMTNPGKLAKTRLTEEDLPDGDSAINDMANLDPDSSVVPTSQKQELTVYF